MAKLKARGRTEVFRVEKNYVKHIGQIAERTLHQLAVMSDGNVLIKRRDTWTISGKVPPDKTAEEILAGYLADNWTLVSESPQYLVRRGHTIEDVSKVPLLTSLKPRQLPEPTRRSSTRTKPLTSSRTVLDSMSPTRSACRHLPC